MRIASETFGTILSTPTFELQGSQRKKKKRKCTEKNFEEIIVENFPYMGKDIVNHVQEAQSPLQDKPNEKHIKMHINQVNRD